MPGLFWGSPSAPGRSIHCARGSRRFFVDGTWKVLRSLAAPASIKVQKSASSVRGSDDGCSFVLLFSVFGFLTEFTFSHGPVRHGAVQRRHGSTPHWTWLDLDSGMEWPPEPLPLKLLSAGDVSDSCGLCSNALLDCDDSSSSFGVLR